VRPLGHASCFALHPGNIDKTRSSCKDAPSHNRSYINFRLEGLDLRTLASSLGALEPFKSKALRALRVYIRRYYATSLSLQASLHRGKIICYEGWRTEEAHHFSYHRQPPGPRTKATAFRCRGASLGYLEFQTRRAFPSPALLITPAASHSRP
jgi:hypothetical protein